MTNEKRKFNMRAGIFCKCPNCGEGKLLHGLMSIHKSCEKCGEDFSEYDTADGPAFFAITIIGTIVGLAAGIFEIIAEPSIWAHLALWIPATLIGSIAIIRITKGLMCAHQYQLGHQGMSQ